MYVYKTAATFCLEFNFEEVIELDGAVVFTGKTELVLVLIWLLYAYTGIKKAVVECNI